MVQTGKAWRRRVGVGRALVLAALALAALYLAPVAARATPILEHTYDDQAAAVTDVSGAGHPGTRSGPTYSTDTPDASSHSLSFASGNSYSVSSLNNFNFGSAISISFWVKRTAAGVHNGYSAVVNNGYGDGAFDIRFGREDSFQRLWFAWGTATLGQNMTDFFDVTMNVWHRIGFTYDGSFMRGSLDGVQQFQHAWTGALLQVAHDVVVGNNANLEDFVGLVDDLKIDSSASPAVPEPASALLAGAGALLALARRRRSA